MHDHRTLHEVVLENIRLRGTIAAAIEELAAEVAATATSYDLGRYWALNRIQAHLQDGLELTMERAAR